MKQFKFAVFLLTTILLGVCTLSGYDIIYEKMNRLMDKSGLRKRIVDSQTQIPGGVVIQKPSANQILDLSTIFVQGTATGKKIDFVEVRLDSENGNGEWFKANGTSPWNYTFSDRTNRPYIIKARAYNEKGYGAEVSVSFAVSNHGPLVTIISGPTNSFTTNHAFTITLSVSENNGYWITNNGSLNPFLHGTPASIVISTNSVLKFFGKDQLGNTSSTQIKRYLFGTNTPIVSIICGPTTNILVTNQPFTIKLATTGNFGYWSTNGSSFLKFNTWSTQTIQFSANSYFGLRYYGENFQGKRSAIKTNWYSWGTSGMQYKFMGSNYMLASGGIATNGTIIIPKYYRGLPLQSVSNKAFYNFKKITNVVMPSTIKSIDEGYYSYTFGVPPSEDYFGAFSGCSTLRTVSLSSNLITIGKYAFYYCLGLRNITIPNTVTSIGQNAFTCCINLKTVIIPNSVTSIGNSAFGGCYGLSSIIIPNNVTSIYGTFSSCKGLTNVTIGNSIISIGASTFYNCNRLTSVIIPNSATFIGGNAFSYCTGLISATIGSSVISIDSVAFIGCSMLTNITMKNSNAPNLLNMGVNYRQFDGCSAILKIHVPSMSALTNYKTNSSWKAAGYTNLIVYP